MRFRSTNSQSPTNAQLPHLSNDITFLLEEGRRLASILPLSHDSQSQHPLSRLASVGLIRVHVRQCIAAIGNATDSQLASLRERLGKAIQSINTSSEATARSLFDSSAVQDALWAWSTAEASIFIRTMTKNTIIDTDKLTDLAGEAVVGFMRQDAKRPGTTKVHPWLMARTWDRARMPDPLGTLRKYLYAWCKNVVQTYYQQQIHEGVSLDAPIAGAGAEGASIGEMTQDRNAPNPETSLIEHADPQTQAASISQIFNRQVASLQSQIDDLAGKTDSYSIGQRANLQNRSDAIREIVGPLLTQLQKTAEVLSVTAADHDLAPEVRDQELKRLRADYDKHLQAIEAISDAQARALGMSRDDGTAKKKDGGRLVSDPLSTERANARFRSNADTLLPFVYRSLVHKKGSDLAQKYTSGLVTNNKLLDGIDTDQDLHHALASDPAIRGTANARALFAVTALRAMMLLRDQQAYGQKHSVVREQSLPRSGRERFCLIMKDEIERDPVLRSKAPQMLDLLGEYISGNGFRTLLEHIDYTSRAGAYEWARNEKINKRWDELSQEESSVLADEAGTLLYDNTDKPFAARNLQDTQNRTNRDLRLNSEERRQIMREEAERIRAMQRGDIPRGYWSHAEPAEGGRFLDKPRAQSDPFLLRKEAYTTSATEQMIRPRRFAVASKLQM